ncbi:MAG: sigma 54-interacting transcriptional regulator, partial [Bilophila wadsworthia]
VKLLRVLQEQEFERLGGMETRKVDVRVVAATSRNLEQMVKDGLFRRDLYYRLNVFPVSMPPLRERQGDIPLLVENFLEKYGHKIGKRGLRVAPEAEALLLAHSWPGNIRELENVIERAVILTTDGLIRPDLLPPAMQAPCALCSLRGTLPDALEQLERQLITEALQEHRGNMGHAAQALGISERVMGLRMRKFGLGYKAFRRGTP